MLITFKSDADGDVIMFGAVGRRMLEIFGKDPDDTQGILTVEQLPDAILALQAAIEQDRLDNPPDEDEDEWGRDAIELQALRERRQAREREVSLARRAAPLLDMLRHAQRGGVVVVWES
ncbi:DUF1840 domain-containing protein [Uliginosibacterium sp. 31-16]|uniref:DUF1840 domain-containing protein n=1 Tax=Uliginosibacterium sp. 31-16 TaxID=3068315 RepID=UPI00273DB82F|nr:DUF1840 domain-containing protein [Uliginosibacterium sp. 31-16]MDP5238661.1 DUF1840 domain-containing protein [Uliginosibacterium sp. 31-16]